MNNKFFENSKLRGAITVGVPLAFSVTSGVAISSLVTGTWKTIFWIVTVALAIFLLSFVIMSGKYDDNKKIDAKSDKDKIKGLQQSINELNQSYSVDKENFKTKLEAASNKIDALSSVYKDLNKILHDYSDALYKTVKNKKNHSEIDNWNELKANCDDICNCLNQLVTNISYRGKEFSVSIIFKRDNNGVVEFNMLSRKTYSGHTPRLHNNFINEDEFKNYHFKRLFDRKINRPNYLCTAEAIRGAFIDLKGVRYSQYIGIPIACTGNKMIALMQIISYNDSLIAENEYELEKLYNEYFCVFSNLVLLADKIENTEKLVDELS